MLTKITTPVTLFEIFQTMRRQSAMERSQGRNERTHQELYGHRRHIFYALRNPTGNPSNLLATMAIMQTR